MQFTKIIGFVLFLSLFGFKNLNAQTQKKTTAPKKPQTTVKTVPSLTKNKTTLKLATKKATMARKQQIKKAIRRSKISRRPIRRR
ncbi:MAG: hypothetical protein J7K39_10100 [Bacteroidales bacterium]|nr:hypothetical protein [Bacteroidales bacterium]